MHIVIAGGTGLIGSRLVKSLAADDHQVFVLSRQPEKYKQALPTQVNLVQWDGKSAGDWVRYVDGADVIVNFAGENLAGEGFLPDRWTNEKKQKIRQSRSNSAYAIIEALKMAKNRPPVLLQSSAIGYYGPRGDERIVESSLPGDDFLGRVAVEWEDSTAEAETLGVRRIITRTGLIMADEGGPLERMVLPYKLFGGVYFGDGKQWWSWIHIEDELRALRFLMEHESASGPYNLTAPNPVTNREFGKILGKVMDRPSYMPVPRFAMNLLVGEVATVVVHGQRVVPAKLLELGFSFKYPELKQALEEILSD